MLSFPKLLIGIVLTATIITGMVFGYTIFFESTIPTLALTPANPVITQKTPCILNVQDQGMGLETVRVIVRQNNHNATVLAQTFPAAQHEWSATFDLQHAKLTEGPFDILVTCTDRSLSHLGKGNTNELKEHRIMDNHPPRVDVISRQHNIAVGGCGAVVYTLSEPVKRTGVMVGNRFFPGFKQDAANLYMALFAFPYDADPAKDVPKVIAEDDAGNTAANTLAYHLINKRFRHDTIRISDRFLEQKMPQFTSTFPNEPDLVSIFLKINNQGRAANRARLKQFAQQSSPNILWNKAFIRQPGAATRATFGDKRDYIYKGKVIDHQCHLGIDLASVARDKVKACNTGKVVFQGFMGIYGNVILIDHGMGLQSLYAHLSQILVHEGDLIQRGQIIGRTGATGLAGGDHLHLGIILNGLPVNPVEWWDSHWINNNITSKQRIVQQLSQSPTTEPAP